MKRIQKNVLYNIKWNTITIISALFVLLLLGGCRTTKQITNEVNNKKITEKEVIEKRDSIYIYKYDSVSFTFREKGDTIIIQKEIWKTKYEYRDVFKVDTIIKIDSIFISIEVVKTIEPTKGQIFWQQFGKISAIIIILFVAFQIVRKKFLKKHKNIWFLK